MSVTMQTVCDAMQKVMALWEQALTRAKETGYFKDADACARVCEAYGDEITDALKNGKFSGDSEKALQGWLNICVAEKQYREALTAEARLVAPTPDPNCWWMVLECDPDAKPEDVKKVFREKMKACHPDRVEGMAPQIKTLANDMAQRLTRAMRDFEARTP